MPLTLATFNVKDLLESFGREALAPKIEWLARAIARLDADVIAFQEVGSAELVRAIARGYGEPVVGTPDDRGIRCALVSRLPVVRSRVFTASSLEFPVFREGDPRPFGDRIPLRRGVVYAEIEGGVHVLVAHFKSRLPVALRDANDQPIAPTTTRARAEGELRSLVRRAAEALHVRGLVDDLVAQHAGEAIAVMGDLNDVADSIPVRVVAGDDLRFVATIVPPEARYSVLHDGERSQIDHILVTEPLYLRLESARFDNADLRQHPMPKPDDPPTTDSDHAPFVARFR